LIKALWPDIRMVSGFSITERWDANNLKIPVDKRLFFCYYSPAAGRWLLPLQMLV
jgi:hypothetical protein